MSLRARLVATVLVLLALAGAGIGVVTTVSLRTFLMDRLDEDVVTSGRIAGRPPPPDAPAPAPGGDDLFAGPGLPFGILNAVVDGGSVTAAGTIDADGVRRGVPASATPGILSVEPGAPPVSVDLGELGAYRLVAVDRGPSTVVTGLPERRVHDTLATLIAVEVAAVALALLGAGVAGTVAVRRTLRPLEEVAATATRVGALPLASGEVQLADRVAVVDPRSEVGQMGAALNRMLDHVGAALEARHDSEMQLRQFVADASHELRTPLAAIRGYAELTRREGADTGYSLTRISSQAERMSALVEDLLLLARLDAGRPLERIEVDLTRLVLDAVGDAHATAPGHHWRPELPDEPVAVTGDPTRLAQVLANLLANAHAHTPAGTVVTVTLSGDDHGGAALRVVDDGPGIAPDLLPRVFERFARRSAGRSREHGSTGLGLAIVAAVVAAHRGRVLVTSRPGRTEFLVRLPPAETGPTARVDHETAIDTDS